MRYFLIFIFLILISCSSFKEAGKVLRNEKTNTTDEFLVKKREPLVLPPDFKEIPEPGSIKKENNSEQQKLKIILKAPNNENSNSSSSNVEKSIIDKINNSRYTRIPFWKGNPENIIGLLNVRTLNIDLKNHNESKEIIFDKISNPWFIPETTNLLEQLVEFKKRKEHLAFVVDEFGELLGLITLEDIIEEIVGEIVDEIDIPENDFKQNNYGKIIINGEKNIRDLYKSFDLDPPEVESSTIAGYILDISKKIPSYGESFKDNYFNFKILSHSKKQISKVEISKIN